MPSAVHAVQEEFLHPRFMRDPQLRLSAVDNRLLSEPPTDTHCAAMNSCFLIPKPCVDSLMLQTQHGDGTFAATDTEATRKWAPLLLPAPVENEARCLRNEQPPQPQHGRTKDSDRSPADDTIGPPPLQDIYEVEAVLDMRRDGGGAREFLIKWKDWGSQWNSWEPEAHILDRRLLRRFNLKRPAVHESAPPIVTDATIQLHSKRRCAKDATFKVMMAGRQLEDED